MTVMLITHTKVNGKNYKLTPIEKSHKGIYCHVTGEDCIIGYCSTCSDWDRFKKEWRAIPTPK